MFDRKKLLAFLRLQRAPDYPPEIITNGGLSVPDDNLDTEMDRYDLTKQPPQQSDWSVNYNPIVSMQQRNAMVMNGLSQMAQPIQYMYSTYGQVAMSPSAGFQIQGFPIPDDYQAAEQEGKKRKHKTFADKVSELSKAPAQRIAAPPKRSPDYIACLTGWRAWAVSKGKLESLGTDVWWKPKQAEQAHCTQSGDHEDGCPSKSCQCGWWSFKSMALMTRALEGYLDSVAVVGIVDVWGKVIECENGYRSEFAYPRELWLIRDNLEWLSYTYGVPVRKL